MLTSSRVAIVQYAFASLAIGNWWCCASLAVIIIPPAHNLLASSSVTLHPTSFMTLLKPQGGLTVNPRVTLLLTTEWWTGEILSSSGPKQVRLTLGGYGERSAHSECMG